MGLIKYPARCNHIPFGRGDFVSNAWPEIVKAIFELKGQTITTLVRQVTIDRDRKLHVETGLNLPKIFSNDASQRSERKNKGEIKTIGIYPGWRDNS